MRFGFGLRRFVLPCAVCAFLLLGAAAAAANTYWAPGATAVLPADHASPVSQYVSIDSISCASAGNCSAVGTYLDSSDHVEGLLLTETAGKWAPGVEAVLPADAAAGYEDGNHVSINSVSCASPGNCSAVGSYPVPGSAPELDHGLLLDEVAGVWQTGMEAVPPTNATEGVALSSVSCPSPGNCTAVGGYGGDVGGSEGILLTETNGTWERGVEAALPANSTAALGLSAVSCPAVGNCAAVGTYVDGAGDYDGLLLDEIDGSWKRAVEAVLPPDAVISQQQIVSLNSLSCPSAGNCSAVGSYNQGLGKDGFGAGDGLLLTESNGTWAPGVEAKLWGSVAPSDNTSLAAVSCSSAGDCSAVGRTDGQGVLLTQTSGVWSDAAKAMLPADAQAKTPSVGLGSISCPSAGNCTAVGGYLTNAHGGRALVQSETAGHWQRAVEAALPAKATKSGGAGLASISCPSVRACNAVGIYTGPGHSLQGLLLASSATPPKTCLVPRLRGKTLSAAARSIKSHHCSLGRIAHTASPTVPEGHVISQEPQPGKRLKTGARLKIVVSTGR